MDPLLWSHMVTIHFLKLLDNYSFSLAIVEGCEQTNLYMNFPIVQVENYVISMDWFQEKSSGNGDGHPK